MFLTQYFMRSPGSGPRLRIGVLLDTDQISKPLADVLDHVRRADFTELVVRIYNATPAYNPAGTRPPLPIRAARVLLDSQKRSRLLWSFYDRVDRRLAADARRRIDPVDVSAALNDVPRIDVQPITKGFVHRFPPEAVEAVRGYDLDVILRFGFNILRGDILQCARYGIWSFHHGDNDYYRGGPPHFWELVEQHPLSGVMLQILNEALDAGRVLCKGWAPTESTLLLSNNRVQPYLLGATFVIRKLFELHRGGMAELEAKAVPAAPYIGKQKIYRAPTNWQVIQFFGPRLIKKALARPFRRLPVQHWRMAFRIGRPLRLRPGTAPDLTGFHWVESPCGRFYADPFLFARHGRVYCFFEDYHYATDHGRICCGVVTEKGELMEVAPALDPAWHLSYPFIFEDGGEIFLIPESANHNSVDLYRAAEFPYRWEKVLTLLEAPGRDTTIFRRDGRYWLFTSVSEPPDAAQQLLLLYSDRLTGPYQFHYQTPVSADSRYARCAGRIFEQDGMLIRPSQDACGAYGRRVHFQRILTLSERCYQEETFTTMEGAPGFGGVHTYDRAGEVETIDGWRFEPASRHLR
jgi:hypothetical protein